MFECETVVKSWGNSLGVVLPKKKVAKENISVNQKVRIIVTSQKKLTAREIFGKLKFKTPTHELKKMWKKELDSKFFR
ncbi:MAG: hypothetical protein ABIG89_06505 [Candidatus Woesearchaeota archaeon]